MTEQAPDLTRKVLGYRIFMIRHGALASTGVDYHWLAGVNRARCIRGAAWERYPRHAAPDHDCLCGLYAVHELPAMWEAGSGTHALGVIRAWGRLEVHPAGFRAEYAEIAALLGTPSPLLNRLARNYGVEVVDARVVKELALERWNAAPIPDALIPAMPETAPATFASFGGGYITPNQLIQRTAGEAERMSREATRTTRRRIRAARRGRYMYALLLALNLSAAASNGVLFAVQGHVFSLASALGSLVMATWCYGKVR